MALPARSTSVGTAHQVDLAVVPEIGVVHHERTEEVHAEVTAAVLLLGEELAARRVEVAHLELLRELGGEADASAIREQLGEVPDAHEIHGRRRSGARQWPSPPGRAVQSERFAPTDTEKPPSGRPTGPNALPQFATR